MYNDLNITLIQFDIAWEQKEKNLFYLENILNNFSGESNIFVLPEMFSTGFSMNAGKLAETMNGETVKWLNRLSGTIKAVIIGSIIISENGKYFNRLICSYPDGKIFYYDKRHLFRMGDEDNYFSRGNEKLIIEVNGWRIRPLICYDLRFPVWSRNCNDYDCLVYIANWPSSRNQIWEKLLVARAIENYSYSVGVNRIGRDGIGINYTGYSTVVDFKGKILFQANPETESFHSLKLSLTELLEFRKKFPLYLDSDKFEIINPSQQQEQ